MTDAPTPYRGQGRTTAQMKEAPQGAVYVWCNDYTVYARQLARSLGRTDLTVIAPCNIDYELTGRKPRPVVVDHAAQLTRQQALLIDAVKEQT